MRQGALPRFAGCPVWLGLCLILSACAGPWRLRSKEGHLPQAVNPILLDRELTDFMEQALARVAAEATDISSATRDRAIREHAMRLKIRVQSVMLRVTSDDDPRNAFLTAWGAIALLRRHYTVGAGRETFGPYQPRVAALTVSLEDDLLALGRRFFPPDRIEAARDDMEAMTTQIQADPLSANVAAMATAIGSDLRGILRIPMLPLSGLEGVSSTPAAIDRFTQTARNLGEIAQILPQRFRWEAQLLLLEAESTGAVAAALNRLDALEEIGRDLDRRIGEMPAALGAEAKSILDAVEKSYREIQSTLVSARQTTQEVAAALEKVQTTGRTLDATGASWSKTATAWQEAAEAVRGLLADWRAFSDGQASSASSADAASDTDYTRMASEIRTAAVEMRGLLGDLRDPLAPESGPRQAAQLAEAVVAAVFWRAVLFAVILFVLAVLWLYARRRMTAPRA